MSILILPVRVGDAEGANYVAINMDFMLGTKNSVPEEQNGISLFLTFFTVSPCISVHYI
jgi:hypothetical protein